MSDETNGELDKLLDASTTRIGEEPGESNPLTEDDDDTPSPEAGGK
ncbi:hypothetical protein [Corynebacterium timonense]|uniref:Uncharacterized protein n=1 Tax=Corynebacterium timonense TaxID=441500 RepID=A0A1H1LJN2_9CORY|nr:hypothetical protein [Corynebacterium timonense]SDR74791.1 hypothetical protein SAMN04488539_0244 [Corynebacterium timonense]